jgi:hypothetical protein
MLVTGAFPERVFWLMCLMSLMIGLLSLSGRAQEPVLVDEFPVLGCDHYLMRLDNILSEARNNPAAQVHVLIYEGREVAYNSRTKKSELMLPTFGSADAKFRSIKKRLAYRELPPDRFRFVKAGFREDFILQAWLVPPGAKSPVQSPTLSKIRYRKGKPRGFCIECCGP